MLRCDASVGLILGAFSDLRAEVMGTQVALATTAQEAKAALGAMLDGAAGWKLERLPCREWNCEDSSWPSFDPAVTRTRSGPTTSASSTARDPGLSTWIS
jgi:hypothetical protein